ncbi:MAG TPA: hypothetical protein VGT44_04930 [Ktedonobacteraceae bacterium]|nr:hypothetical protein [Ktedonobacteraceae bacterium]
MNNTSDENYTNNTPKANSANGSQNMNHRGLPPIPAVGESGPDVCAIVQMYLAIIDDLTPQEVALLSEHVVTCAACGEAFELMERATHLVGSLTASAPSPRVDVAMLALTTAGTGTRQVRQAGRQPVVANSVTARRSQRPARRRKVAWVVSELVAAAVILLALFASLHQFGIFGGGPQTAFALPSSLSWSGFVLYHSETRTGTHGELYEVESYHDLKTGSVHVETKMDGQLDVVTVSDGQQVLGMDTIHHIAQMGANQWTVNDSMFNLNELRRELQMGQATYLGLDSFKGQSVYRIRCTNGLVMLLDMQYMPVNVLRGAVGPGTGSPLYTNLELLTSTQVPDSMWNMSVPPGYQMGTLPAQP